MSLYNKDINKVAVIGSGVMGGQIAAHFANSGIKTVLLDIQSKGGKNKLVEDSVKKMLKAKPAPFAHPSFKDRLILGNLEDDLNLLCDCDLVIEAVVENLEIKQNLYKNVQKFLSKDAILASNTSSISIEKLTAALDDDIKKRFCNIHFFNPPRYMYLVELIKGKDTREDVLEKLEGFITQRLGKGVVYAKDTTGFIGNRIGIMALALVDHYRRKYNFSIELVDELTGSLIGRPKTATYRLADLVGIDIFSNVLNIFKSNLSGDPWSEIFESPKWMNQLIENKSLGNKTGQGIYKKKGKDIFVYDEDKDEYRPKIKEKLVSKDIKKILGRGFSERIEQIRNSDSKELQFVWDILRDLYHYCACRLGEISFCARDIDFTLRWGFGWKEGPFESWQKGDFAKVVKMIDEDIKQGKSFTDEPLPQWVFEIDEVHNERGSYSVDKKDYLSRSSHLVYKRQTLPLVFGEKRKTKTVVLDTESLCAFDTGDGVIAVSFKTKMNTLSYQLIQDLFELLELVEEKYKALIFWQENPPFCAGANIFEILMATKLGMIYKKAGFLAKTKKLAMETFMKNMPKIDDNLPPIIEVIDQLQRLFMKIRYSSFPTISATQGLVLGGGCELMLHCNSSVVALESYIGLVEVGVGLLPAGGGTKEMILRASQQAVNEKDLFDRSAKFFEQIAMGKVATSAYEAREMGYVRPSDKIVMNANELLHVARAEAMALYESDFHVPDAGRIKTINKSGRATIMSQVVNMKEGEFISQHDYLIADYISRIFSADDVQGSFITEKYLLSLENKYFCKLLETGKSQDRIENMLRFGKPLRN
ncbi:3-hydroxyacyl-CoA dehydrogenase/enoyl-CoA hydratase family protein [Ichthyobacterium seriolicida]|uniref:3-hydroxyacyl-CoA dehydrogenase oxidoreductase n=1 Tax=Ichthyobacterium seriolicida TaxID=242600 RepID=A0A1J1DYD5_9FLAO|nr:3-hydroxyacyl-CoA dehydrogenase/enoyl-CoA hydratase family protein [Ichthyobacterium seriolicida]BAV94873.1 3-hydroxyacyl-CoA dehydrogenase oxidoreductase [Ichthyobacterium seriolicida]